ncbi:uncharacterized protein LOC133197935 [Saccostrea echinata]|uniref:uncharacterized protein LOC133197935 n=1 Tax=Saccostrea echinata TaxID=191078 RepID=UPI002A826311|nr:uncharacterized protein LOC133197935 [Saccostrea echinata]
MISYRDVISVLLFGIVYLLYQEISDISTELTVKKEEEKQLLRNVVDLRYRMSFLTDDVQYVKFINDQKKITNENSIGNIYGTLTSALVQLDLIMSHIRKETYLFTNSTLFDSATLHGEVYVSENRKLLSNTDFPSALQGPGLKPLIKYIGVKADKTVSRQEEWRLNFIVKYNITKTLEERDMIFDLSFCKENNTDNLHYGGMYCLSMHAAHIGENLHLLVEKFNHYLHRSTALSPSTQGTTATLGFNVLISGLNGTIVFRDLLSGKEIFAVKSIDFSEPLFIMFGLYNKKSVQSMISLI